MFKNPIAVLIIAVLLLLSTASFAGGLAQGLDYYNAGEYQKAEVYFRSMVIKEPWNYSAKYMLAVSLVNRQKYNEAKDLYKEVILNSNNDRLTSLSRTGLTNLDEPVNFTRQTISADKAVININTAGNSIIVNNVRLNDRLKTSFILDTGATFTSISRETAQKLGIRTKGAKQIKVMTGSGFITVPLVKVPKMEVKGLVARNVKVIVTDLPAHSAGTSKGVAGLLGLSFLENFRVTVDRKAGQVTLEKI